MRRFSTRAGIIGILLIIRRPVSAGDLQTPGLPGLRFNTAAASSLRDRAGRIKGRTRVRSSLLRSVVSVLNAPGTDLSYTA